MYDLNIYICTDGMSNVTALYSRRQCSSALRCMTLLIKLSWNIIKNMNESQGLTSSKQLQGVAAAG